MEAFEGSKDVLKTLREKAKSVGKIVLKEAKKAAGMHVGQVTEANPVYYVVIAPQGAMVRAGIELDSPAVHGLHRGDLVTCVDLSGRRARIIDPVEGWVSVKTQSNEPILEVTIAPDRETQISQMERRFERLKAEKQKSSPESSDVPIFGNADQAVAESESSPASMTAIKSKLAFKSPAGLSGMHSSTGSGIPKLSGPCGKPHKVNVTKGIELLNLDSPPKTNSLLLPKQTTDISSVLCQKPTQSWADPFSDLVGPSSIQHKSALSNEFMSKGGNLAPGSSVSEEFQVAATTRQKLQPNSQGAINELDDWFQ